MRARSGRKSVLLTTHADGSRGPPEQRLAVPQRTGSSIPSGAVTPWYTVRFKLDVYGLLSVLWLLCLAYFIAHTDIAASVTRQSTSTVAVVLWSYATLRCYVHSPTRHPGAGAALDCSLGVSLSLTLSLSLLIRAPA